MWLSNFPAQARKVLDAALAVDQASVETVLALAQLDVIENKYTDAVTRYS